MIADCSQKGSVESAHHRIESLVPSSPLLVPPITRGDDPQGVLHGLGDPGVPEVLVGHDLVVVAAARAAALLLDDLWF